MSNTFLRGVAGSSSGRRQAFEDGYLDSMAGALLRAMAESDGFVVLFYETIIHAHEVHQKENWNDQVAVIAELTYLLPAYEDDGQKESRMNTFGITWPESFATTSCIESMCLQD